MYPRARRIWQFIGILLIIIAIFFEIHRSYQLIVLTERHKCPLCFGQSLCSSIDSKDIVLETSIANFFIYNLINVKNIYYGKYKNQKVILKKLAHQSEFENFDQMIVKDPYLSKLFENTESSQIYSKDEYKNVFLSELNPSDINNPNNKLIVCPSLKNINVLLKNIMLNNIENQELYQYLWTLVKINPEPIILQILPPEEGWPTAKYYGTCGRLVIEKYIGSPLSTFYKEPWIKRASIAASLLDAAFSLTFKDPNFAYYLTDPSIDNIAVDEKNQVIFVDLENVIIVDKNIQEKSEVWNATYVVEIFQDCSECFIFSPIDLCNHHLSDHNYYAICQHILYSGLSKSIESKNFLSPIPENINQHFPELETLIKQCSNPEPLSSRIPSGIHLRNTLQIIINKFKYK